MHSGVFVCLFRVFWGFVLVGTRLGERYLPMGRNVSLHGGLLFAVFRERNFAFMLVFIYLDAEIVRAPHEGLTLG